MPYQIIPVTPFAQNCTLFWCEKTRVGVVIDPGGDVARILQAIQTAQVTVQAIVLTHGHLDHVGGAPTLAAACGVPIWGPHEADAYWLEGLAQQAKMFGFPPVDAFLPDRWLHDGETLTVGDLSLEVLHCPGHTPGHVVLYCAQEHFAQVGDVLFAGSIGRTDFPGGDYDALITSIRERLFPLGDDVQFVAGHGEMSSFGKERRSNPFVSDRRVG